MAEERYDALVVGAGPNGLSAAIQIARAGYSVCVLEANAEIGGGARTNQLTLPDFHHDICSAVHPTGKLSPFFNSIPLEKYGLEWIEPPIALAHPFDSEPAAFLSKSLPLTAGELNMDGPRYLRFMKPLVADGNLLMREVLKPIRFTAHPYLMSRFGIAALMSASRFATTKFKTGKARALFAGCAAHSMVALDKAGTASFGMILSLAAHLVGWPIIKGGSQKIVDCLAQCLIQHGGKILTDRKVTTLKSLPPARAILLAITPKQISRIAGEELPAAYIKKLIRFRYGPGNFKMDWALSGPIPWKDETCRRAGTVHLGCSFEEILKSEDDAWEGRITQNPFVLLAQPSCFDPTRAPSGKHVAWAYCHVPNGCLEDRTTAIEAQIERFAPGFRDCILARHSFNTAQLEQHNQNLIGGDIGGGANDLPQFLARPVLKWDPYTTPNPRIFICSSSTPPGGGVHGMCGYHAANAALKKVFGPLQ